MIDGESSKAVFRKCSSGDMTAVILIKTSPDLTRFYNYTKRAFTGENTQRQRTRGD